MGITSSTIVTNVAAIPCGGTFQVTLAWTAAPDITTNPTDIVLILDRSGSMAQSLPSLKEAAKMFIDIIDESTQMAHRMDESVVAAESGSSAFQIPLCRTPD